MEALEDQVSELKEKVSSLEDEIKHLRGDFKSIMPVVIMKARSNFLLIVCLGLALGSIIMQIIDNKR